LKTLKLNSDKFTGQLESRIGELDTDQQLKIERLKRENLEAIQNLETAKQRKADHLKYFHEHIMKRLQNLLKLNSEENQKNLEERVHAIESEKNNSLEKLRLETENQVRQMQLEKQKRLSHLK